MNDLHLQSPGNLVWLLAIAGLALLFRAGIRRRQRALAAFADRRMLARISPPEDRRSRLRVLVACAAMACVAIALARPVSNPHPRQVLRTSRDLVFVVDVSRSMLAQDCLPNRLEAARLAIADCVAELPGQRVGLVVFAGTASIKCPLTSDRVFFNELLGRIGPDDVSHGGTIIRDALLKTVEKLLDKERAGFQDVVLISDGGSHEADPHLAVDALNAVGGRLICIGVGSDRQGVRIPNSEGPFPFVMHENREVLTRLEADYLRDLAAAVKGGVYLHVATRTLDLADVYEQIIASEPGMRDDAESMVVYDEHFQVPMALGLLLLAIWLWPWRHRAVAAVRGRAGASTVALAALLLVLLCPPGGAQQDDSTELAPDGPADTVAEMQKAMRVDTGDKADEEGGSEAPAPEAPDISPRRLYNAGNIAYRAGSYDQAVIDYAAALPQLEGKLAAWCAYNLGNAHYRLAEATRVDDPATAFGHIQQAVQGFRRSYAAKLGDRSSGVNLELSVRLRREIQQQLEKQQQQADQQKQKQSEGDPSESDDNGDPEEGDSDEQSDANSTMSSLPAGDSDGRVDLEADGTPPPNLDPEQILNEERENNARRSAAGHNRRGNKVEKDW